jgi:hypothetical protein
VSSAAPDLLFEDDTIDAASGWNSLNAKGASFVFSDGRLASTYSRKGSWAYAVHDLAAAQSVVRVSGTFSSSGAGYYGWLCGDSTTGRYYGAVPETDDGSLVFIAGGYDGVQPLERYEDLGRPVITGASAIVGLECVSDHGVIWLEAFVGDGEPIALHEEIVDDVTHFDVVGMYGEALEPGFAMDVTRVTGYGNGGAAGSISVDAAGFVATLPRELADECVEQPESAGAMAVRCYIQDEGPGAELLGVAQYADMEATNAAYAASAVAPSAACAESSLASSWAHGSLRCVGQTVGIRLEWTDDRSATLGTLVDYEATDVAATLAQWQGATSDQPL